MKHRQTACLAAAALILLAWPLAAHAQQVRILGRVIEDETMVPIAGAEINVFRAGGGPVGRAFTDQNGRFSFRAPEQGGYRFVAARIGYEQTETPVLWTDGYEEFQVEIRMAPDAVLLAPIEILARARGEDSPVLESFWSRRETGLGHYFTREEIEEIRPSRVSDLVARVPGVRLESSGSGLRRVVYMGRGAERCPALIYVDGFLWNRPSNASGLAVGTREFTIDDAVHPGSVMAIEVYRGLASVPAEFLAPGAKCGVVAIWTRR